MGLWPCCRGDGRVGAVRVPMKKRILTPKKAERLRRETERARKERWKYGILIALIAVMGIVVGTAAFIYDRKLHRGPYPHQQLAGPTNKNDLKASGAQEETFR